MYMYDEVDSLYVSQVCTAFVDEEYIYIFHFHSRNDIHPQPENPPASLLRATKGDYFSTDCRTQSTWNVARGHPGSM